LVPFPLSKNKNKKRNQNGNAGEYDERTSFSSLAKEKGGARKLMGLLFEFVCDG